jgi:PAS domain S-box-containing protein
MLRAGDGPSSEADEALRQDEQELHAMFEMASIGIAQADPRTRRWVRVNRRMCAITGYTAEELLGKRVPEITHPEDTERDKQAYERMARGEMPDYRIEKRYLRKDGSVAWVNVNMALLRNPSGEPLRTVATVEDITPRKEAEEDLERERAQLRASRERFSRLFHQNPIPTAVLRISDRVILDANDAYAVLSGYELDQLKGRTTEELAIALLPDEEATLLASLAAHGTARSEESLFRTRSADLATVILTLVAVEIDGESCAVTAVVDVTERRRIQEAMLRAQKLEALGTFAGGIAHDFNNVLLAITGNLKLAVTEVPPDHPVQESLTEIAKAASRATALVRRILAFSRPVDLNRQTLALGPVIEEGLALVQAMIPSSIGIRHEIAADTPTVSADPTQIHQVIVNLAANAAQAIGTRPGCISIRLEGADVPPKSDSSRRELLPGRYARLVVSDDGCGMTAATLERIFDPFFSTKPAGQGTGLGLSIVHGIVKSLGGTILAESELGNGSTFTIFLPAGPAESTA